jgi:hypothetical protein
MHQVQLCCPEIEFLNGIFVGFLGIESSQTRFVGFSIVVFQSYKMLFMNRLFSFSADFLYGIFLSGIFAEEVKSAVGCRDCDNSIEQNARAFVKFMSKNSISGKNTFVHSVAEFIYPVRELSYPTLTPPL